MPYVAVKDELTCDKTSSTGHLLQEDDPLSLVGAGQDDAHGSGGEVLLQLQLLGLPCPQDRLDPLCLSAEGICLLGQDRDLPHLAILQLDFPQLHLGAE